MMTIAIIGIVWLFITLLLYLVYRRIYERYMNKILQGMNVTRKLPSLRMVCITYLILSMLTALGGGMYYQQQKLPPLCEGNYQSFENTSMLASEDSYHETWEQYYETRQEDEQINVSYRDIGEVGKLEFSQNEEGYVFLALHIKPMDDKAAYYRISVQAGNSTTSTITKQESDFLAFVGFISVPEERCTRHDITVRMYNIMEGENTNPIDIEETIEISKVVNAE